MRGLGACAGEMLRTCRTPRSGGQLQGRAGLDAAPGYTRGLRPDPGETYGICVSVPLEAFNIVSRGGDRGPGC